jgi:2-haloacid dehalogenase
MENKSSLHEINTIVFDLGGVLIDWNPDYLYRTIFDSKEEMGWFYNNICTPEWNDEQDAGGSIYEATELLVKKFPDHESNIRAYYGRWEDMLGGQIDESVKIFQELKEKQRYRIFALTNWSAETFPRALELFDFLHWFDGRVVSGEEKVRKPFSIIYEILIKRYSIDPVQAVFIDDKAKNLDPASALGFQTIHYTSPTQFRKELVSLRIL